MSGACYYYWVAVFRDGSELQEQAEGNVELSTEHIRAHARETGQPLAMLHLVPRYAGYPYIIQEAGEGEEWHKVATHSHLSGVLTDGSEVPTGYYGIDTLALTPTQERAGERVWLYVLPDGTLRFTTSPYPEGHYAEKPPGYEGPHPYLVDRRYKLESN